MARAKLEAAKQVLHLPSQWKHQQLSSQTQSTVQYALPQENFVPMNTHNSRLDRFQKGEESQEKVKDKDNFSVCSDWDAGLEERDGNNLEVKEQNSYNNKTPQPCPEPTSVDTFQPSKPSIDQFGNQISVSSEIADQKEETLTTLFRHKNEKALEDMD